MIAKAELRREIRDRRKALDPVTAAAEAAATCTAALALLDRLGATTLASYVAAGSELPLAELHHAWWALGRPLWLPSVGEGMVLHWHPVTDAADLRPGAFGILEPDPRRCPPAALPSGAVVLVPGVAFTTTGDRLGQGKGFYDRFLAGRPDATAIGIAYACQLTPAVPTEPHDHPLAGVIAGGHLHGALAGS